MRYEHLPGPSPSKKMTASPAKKVAGHIFSQLRRPSRMRGRFLLVFITVTGILFLHLGHRHADDIQSSASSLSIYMPAQLMAAFAHDLEVDSTRWDDSQDPDLKNLSTSVKGPTFHLLIPARKPTLNLCKAVLSAAILNYPPPTLLGYGQEGYKDRLDVDIVRNALKIVEGKDAHDDDLVLVVDEETVFQLPAEVLMNRFFHTTRDSTYALLQIHGRYPGNFSTLPSQRPQRYYTNVLFGAQKDCSDSSSSPACYFAPPSTLPKDTHDPYNQRKSERKRPGYMTSNMAMGTVGHLRPIYKYASELFETDIGLNGSQQVLSQIFGAQERQRTLYHKSTFGPIKKVSHWIASKFDSNSESQQLPLNHSATLNNSSSSDENVYNEFGIGLDYTSSLFQILDPSSEDDMKFVKFSNLSESLSLSERLMKKIHLPLDLNDTAPFALHPPSMEPLTDLDTLPQALGWSDISLATNIIIPESPVIPSTLNLSPQMNDSTAMQLWYEPYTRALFRQSLRAPPSPITITIPPLLPLKPNGHISVQDKSKSLNSNQRFPSESQEVSYTDLRGGRGGIWTDKGEWKEWNEICGSFNEVLFADGNGVFGKEGTNEEGGNGKNKNDWDQGL